MSLDIAIAPLGASDAEALAYNAALRFLARREHSQQELACKLRMRGHSAEVVEDVLCRLADEGFQSDERFAEGFVRSRIGRGQGLLKIRAALQDRGVDGDLAAAVLDLGDTEWQRLASSALRKRFGDDEPSSGEWLKCARFLVTRGFTRDTVARVLAGDDAEIV